MTRDYYEVLGLSHDASAGEIKKCFRKLARELHPDVNADHDAEDRFKEAAEAYEVLSDPERRRAYDLYGHAGLRSVGWAPHPMGGLEEIFQMFFGSRSPFGFGVAHSADVEEVVVVERSDGSRVVIRTRRVR